MKSIYSALLLFTLFLLTPELAKAFSDCEGTVVEAPEEVELVFTGEDYISVSTESLGINVEYPCGTFEVNLWIDIGDGNYTYHPDIPSSSVGNTVTIKAIVEFSQDDPVVRIINLVATGIDCNAKTVEMPEEIDIVFNGENYIELLPEHLNANIEFLCGTYDLNISGPFSSKNFIPHSWIGNSYKFTVIINFSDGQSSYRHVTVNISGIKPDPIPMYLEDVQFNAEEEFTIDIWSEDLVNLSNWSFEILFTNTEIIAIQNSELFNDIPHNIFAPDHHTIRALWTPLNALPINVESGKTWFSLVLKSKIAGSTADIYQPISNPFNSVGFEGEEHKYEYDADLNFEITAKTVTSTNEELHNQNIYLYPNPSSNTLIIQGITNAPALIDIINPEGQIIKKVNKDNRGSECKLDISELPQGIYVVRVHDGKLISSSKFIKI